MPSRLHTKIHSYPIEKGIEFNFDPGFPWTETGTEPQSTLTNWTITTNSASRTREGTGGSYGAGYWYLDTGRRQRLNIAGSIGAGLADNNYSMGFWFRVNNFTYQGSQSCNIISINPFPTAGNPGFSLALVTNAIGFPQQESIIIQYAGTGTLPLRFPETPLSDQIPMNKWHYIAFVRTGTSMNVYLNGVFNQTITGMGTTTPTGLTFGNAAAAGIDPIRMNYNISNFYYAPASAIGATEIAQIWEAGKTMTTPINHWDGDTWEVALNQKRWDGNVWHEINAQTWDGDSWNTL